MIPVLQAVELSLPPRLQRLSLTLNRGETVGLLGVNGAGKSTALMALAGVLPGLHGELRVMGKALVRQPALRRHIGWLPQQPPLYPDLTAGENLDFFASLQGSKDRAQQLSERFQLGPLRHRLAYKLSGGERMRLALACAMVHGPDILLLDEPTAGLDPLQAEQLRELIQRECVQQTLLIASHLLPDIQQLCSRVLLMDSGRILADLPTAPNRTLVRVTLLYPPPDSVLASLKGIASIVSRQKNEYLIELTPEAPADLAEQLAGHGWGLASWQLEPSDLLSHFRALSTGNPT